MNMNDAYRDAIQDNEEPVDLDPFEKAVQNFQWSGGAVRLVDPIPDDQKHEHFREWGHHEKDKHTLPFGPWSLEPRPGKPLSAGPWVWRYGTAQAGTGSSYKAIATRVHADVASYLGGPIIVTLLSPWQAAYPFADEGYLHPSYVGDKLAPGRKLNDGDLAAVTMLIRILLGRTET